MERISRREFVKRTAVAGAMLTSLPTILEACSTGGTTTGNKPSKLTIAAVQGAEDGPLKKVAPMYQTQTGITMEVVEFPYDQLFEKLVTTFQANGSSYDLCRHMAAPARAGTAIGAEQTETSLRDHHRRQRRDVHVPQGSRADRPRQLG